MIEKVVKWNEEAGNPRGEINRDLEKRMLQEELGETIEAIDEFDFIEAVDGLCDLIFVAIGTMHKLGLNREEISNCFYEVCRSNNTKLPFTKSKAGKVMKSPNFEAPDLRGVLKYSLLAHQKQDGESA